jgi:hypothetical protein
MTIPLTFTGAEDFTNRTSSWSIRLGAVTWWEAMTRPPGGRTLGICPGTSARAQVRGQSRSA